jgi:hypothetical protein
VGWGGVGWGKSHRRLPHHDETQDRTGAEHVLLPHVRISPTRQASAGSDTSPDSPSQGLVVGNVVFPRGAPFLGKSYSRNYPLLTAMQSLSLLPHVGISPARQASAGSDAIPGSPHHGLAVGDVISRRGAPFMGKSHPTKLPPIHAHIQNLTGLLNFAKR